MNSNKIRNIIINAKSIKKEIFHGKEKFKIYFIKESPIQVSFGKVVVNQLFFRTYTQKERIAMLYHEEYHMKFLTPYNRFFNILRFFSMIKARWEEEFNADKYATQKVGKSRVLSCLKKVKTLYNREVAYNPKTHPSIDERIRRIEQL